eukprot:GHVS01075259.1.p1 GENE.GHVS01075259.1~~GHVS01075259.1.p1  ORF type:complete len:398 (-),score=52.34 GHVS01075259.1:1403-2485(-)
MAGRAPHQPRPPPTFSPYGVEYSSAHYPSTGAYTWKWGLRALNLFIFLLILAVAIYIFKQAHRLWLPPTGLDFVDLNGCATIKSKDCKLYKYPHKLRPHDVELVQYNSDTGNYLFRSSLPLMEGSGDFDEKALLDDMSQEASRNNVKMPDTVQLMVYSLLFKGWKADGVDELCELGAEKCWFENKHQLPFFNNLPLKGEDKSPFDFDDPKVRQEKAKAFPTWSRDPLRFLSSQLHENLSTKTAGGPLAILFHCHFGKDRTGLLAGVYRMRYLNYSLEEVWKDNKSFHEDAPRFINGMLWYCFYLEETTKSTHLKCSDWPKIVKATPSLPGSHTSPEDQPTSVPSSSPPATASSSGNHSPK